MIARALCWMLLLFATGALAQGWPEKPVRLVVTFSPGGSSDLVARLIATPLQQELGQPVIVDDKPGRGGTSGALEVARAAADGYTLLLANSAPLSISPAMQERPLYDPVKSFTHVSYIGSVANVFVVHPSLRIKTLGELVRWIRGQPHAVSYGSGGTGSIGHLVGETLRKDQRLRMTHVGYKGSSPMHNDLLGGTIKFAIDTLPQNVAFMKEGKLRAVAVTSPARVSMAPDVPSVLELGYDRLVAENFLGVSGPAGLPQPVVERLHAAMRKSLANPSVLRQLEALGVTGRELSPQAFGEFVAGQVHEWAQAVKDSGAKLD